MKKFFYFSLIGLCGSWSNGYAQDGVLKIVFRNLINDQPIVLYDSILYPFLW